MKNRIDKTVAKKLTVAQLERRWRKEQRAKGVTLVDLDTSEIRGVVLKAAYRYCEAKQIAFSQFANACLEEYFTIHGYIRSGEVRKAVVA